MSWWPSGRHVGRLGVAWSCGSIGRRVVDLLLVPTPNLKTAGSCPFSFSGPWRAIGKGETAVVFVRFIVAAFLCLLLRPSALLRELHCSASLVSLSLCATWLSPLTVLMFLSVGWRIHNSVSFSAQCLPVYNAFHCQFQSILRSEEC